VGGGGGIAGNVYINGNVGIGTNAPTARLDVNGSINVTQTVLNSNGQLITNSTGQAAGWNSRFAIIPYLGAGGYNNLSSVGDVGLIWGLAGSGKNGNLVIAPHNAGGVGVKITADGNVGIGASTPTARLEVAGTIKTTDATPSTDTTSGALQVTGGIGIGGRINAGGIIKTTTTTPSTDINSGALQVGGGAGIGGAVNIGGSIKMGTSNLSYRQFILGGGNSYGYLYGCYAKYGDAIHIGYNFYNDDTSNQIYSAGGATSRLTLGYGTIGCYTGGVNTEPTTLGYFQNSSGQVGIGTSSPTATLHVHRPGATNAYAEQSILNVKGADYINGDGSTTVYSAGITLHASDLIWAYPNRTSGAKIYIGGGYSVGGGIGYNGPIEFSTGSAVRMRINEGGSITIGGALSKGSGTFDIKHPIKEGYRLVHSFTESPRCDLIYRGKKQLINGQIIINIDKECVQDIDCAMTEGTFEALCANPTVYLQNNETFDKVIGKIVGNKLTILCENNTADCVIDWMVVAERKDELIKEWDKTNDNGYLKTEYQS
jgi:hypothetical protein